MNANTTINKNFLIVLLGILAALGPFTIDMYLPGFKQIALDLRTDEKHVAFTLTSYFVGIAVGQLFYGPIVDKYGRKRPLLFGLFIYALSALGCAFSPSIQTMIGMRLLQALGGCVGMVAANAIISDVYEVNQRAKAFSTMILIMGVAPLVAPSIGSFFVEQANWQYIFYFLTLFAFLVGLLIYFFLPETSLHMHSNKLKIKTIGKDYLTILKTKIFFRYIVAGSLSMAILFAYISSASFIFLTHYALSKTTFSILFAINASGLILGSYLNGLLTNYVNYVTIARRASIILGIITLLLLVLIYLKPNLPYPYMVGGLFSVLFTVGFINPNATAASLVPFTGNVGAASALSGAIRMGVGALVAAAIGAFQGNSPITMAIVFFVLTLLASILLWTAPRPTKPEIN